MDPIDIPSGQVGDLLVKIQLPDTTKLTKENSASTDISVNGVYDDHVQMACAISWLCAAIKSSGNEKLCLSETPIATIPLGSGSTRKVLIGPSQLLPVSGDVLCWHALFNYAVVATGFSISPRAEGIGLEISFADMILLAQSKSIDEYDGGLIAEGLSTLLIPMKRLDQDNALQWHLKEKPSRAVRQGYRQWHNQVIDLLKDSVSGGWYNNTTNLEDISSRRAFLGWTGSAKIMLGTTAPRHIGVSGLSGNQPKRNKISHAIGFSGGQWFNITGQHTSTPVSTTTRYTRVDKEEVRNRLLKAVTNQIILYDRLKKTAWLLPEASVLLCLTQQWISRWKYNVYDGDTRRPIPAVAITTNDGATSLQTLTSSLDLRLYPQDPSMGGALRTFSDLLEGLYFSMDRAQEALDKAAEEAHDLGVATPKYIRGVEFMAIALEERHPEVKESKVEQPWACMCEHISIVLVCSNLGQAIAPSDPFSLCNTWRTVPEGQEYMVATVSSINTILDANPHPDGGHRGRLSTGISWIPHRPVIQSHVPGNSDTVYHTQPLFFENRERKTWSILREARLLRDGAYIFRECIGERCRENRRLVEFR